MGLRLLRRTSPLWMADDLKEKTSEDTSKISKETKVVKKVTAAQNKTTNVLKSNHGTTSQASPKSSQPKFSATPTKSKLSTSRASSVIEGRK